MSSHLADKMITLQITLCLFFVVSIISCYKREHHSGEWRVPVYKDGLELATDWSKIGVWMEKTVWPYNKMVIDIINSTINLPSSKDPTVLSTVCRKSLQSIVNGLDSKQLWAFQMMDATPIADSGFIHRFTDLGDYDSCLEVTAPEEHFVGQHCLYELNFALPPPHVKDSLDRVNLTGSKMHRTWLERCTIMYKYLYFQRITSAVCVPSTCTPKEIELLFNEVTSKETPLTVVFHEKCDSRDSRKFFFSEEPLYKRISM
jgi:hypothetical protein